MLQRLLDLFITKDKQGIDQVFGKLPRVVYSDLSADLILFEKRCPDGTRKDFPVSQPKLNRWVTETQLPGITGAQCTLYPGTDQHIILISHNGTHFDYDDLRGEIVELFNEEYNEKEAAMWKEVDDLIADLEATAQSKSE